MNFLQNDFLDSDRSDFGFGEWAPAATRAD